MILTTRLRLARQPHRLPMRLMLVLVLLWAQTLGWQHRIAHVPGHAPSAHGSAHGHVHTHAHSVGQSDFFQPGTNGPADAALSAAAPGADNASEIAVVASASQTARFGHDADQTDACRIFDESALADLLGAEVPVLSGMPERVAAMPAVETASWSARLSAYRARAPPVQA